MPSLVTSFIHAKTGAPSPGAQLARALIPLCRQAYPGCSHGLQGSNGMMPTVTQQGSGTRVQGQPWMNCAGLQFKKQLRLNPRYPVLPHSGPRSSHILGSTAGRGSQHPGKLGFSPEHDLGDSASTDGENPRPGESSGSFIKLQLGKIPSQGNTSTHLPRAW